MNEALHKSRPRDDSATRALMLGSTACAELKLPSQSIDWHRFLEEVDYERRQGHSESQIDWKRLTRNCALTPSTHEKRSWIAVFSSLFTIRRMAQEAIRLAFATILIVLIVFLAKEKQPDLAPQLEALRRDNEVLQTEVEQAKAAIEQLRPSVDNAGIERSPGELNDAIPGDNSISRRRHVDAYIQDRSGEWTIRRGVVMRGNAEPLPADLSRIVGRLANDGILSDTEAARDALRILLDGEGSAELRGAPASSQGLPVPIRPHLTAVRSTRPTLQWEAIADAEQYTVTVAYPPQKENGRVIWESGPIDKNETTLPAGVLQRGQVYFWQVESGNAVKRRLSPRAGFWVLDEAALRDIEAMEALNKDSDMVMVGIYSANGLYDEALVRAETLLRMNPSSPVVRRMIAALRRRVK